MGRFNMKWEMVFMKSTLRNSFYKLIVSCVVALTSVGIAKGAVAGMQDGWAVDPGTDAVLLTAVKAQEIAGGGGKWVRVPFRLGGHTTWDATLLAAYDQVVANCRNAGL